MSNSLPVTRYRIIPRDPHAHVFEVVCTVEQPHGEGQRFRLPSWTPGSYLIREFARHFIAVRAECGGAPVAIAKTAKDTWQAAPCDGPLSVIADVYAYDVSVRTAYLDGTRAFFNGPCLFLCPEGRAAAACELVICPPSSQPNWRVATTLPVLDAADWGFGTYRAIDYDTLIDHPVEIADFARVSFEAGGAVHDVVVSGRHDADLARLAGDLQKVCAWQIDLFGGGKASRSPFGRYLFIVAAVGDGYGGLEHASSTSLLISRSALPRPGMSSIDDDYRGFLGLASHEYFHSWNVKRIRPAAFAPYDLARENYTRELWAFEGFTSYYDDLALVRSGVIDADSYLEVVGRTITSVLRTPGRHRQSVAESSFDAWIKFYRPDENTPNAVVSYYAKGALIGLALDLVLRSSGAASLDDLMRTLWRRHGATREGLPEGAIARIASELAGRDLSGFFQRYVEGVEDPPLDELLAEFAVRLHLRAAEGARDKGGKRAKKDGERTNRCALGAKVSTGAEAKLQHVFTDGPAARAGLSAGDALIAVDGLRVTGDTLDALLERRGPGERIAVHAFRRDELMTFDVVLQAAPDDTCYLTLVDDAPPAALERRRAWLGV